MTTPVANPGQARTLGPIPRNATEPTREKLAFAWRLFEVSRDLPLWVHVAVDLETAEAVVVADLPRAPSDENLRECLGAGGPGILNTLRLVERAKTSPPSGPGSSLRDPAEENPESIAAACAEGEWSVIRSDDSSVIVGLDPAGQLPNATISKNDRGELTVEVEQVESTRVQE